MARKSARSARQSRAARRKRKSRAVPALILLTAAGSATVVGFVLFTRNSSSTNPDDPGIDLPVPDLREIGAGGVATITLKDKDDPNRVVASISFDSQTPIGQGRYDTVNPRAWVHMKDGSYLHIRADEGRFYAPDEQRPQSGVMRGNVVVRLFDPAPQRPADDAVAPIVARLNFLSFDTEYGALWTDEPLAITTPEIEFRANDLRLVINQVQERIELLEVRRGERLTYTPLPNSPQQPIAHAIASPHPIPPLSTSTAPAVVVPIALSQPDTPTNAPAVQPTPPAPRDPASSPPPPPDPVHYLAQFRENVRLTQDAVSATGDSLEVFARLIDNKLPDGAVGRLDDAATRSPSLPARLRGTLESVVTTALASQWPPRLRAGPSELQPSSPDSQPLEPAPTPPNEPQVAPEGSTTPFAPRTLAAPSLSSQAPITLEWKGPLTLRPLATEPAQLEHDHLAARLTGGEGGAVNLADAQSGASGVCASLDYAFTTRSLVLTGVGDSGVRLSAGGTRVEDPARPDQPPSQDPGGTLRAGRAEYSLATGIGRVPGAGTLEGGPFQRIDWNQQMDFVLRSERGRVVSSLEEVMFRGDVRGEDESASFDAGFTRAEFVGGEGQPAQLSAIILDDQVTIRGRDEERVSATSVRVEFEPSAQPTPNPIASSAPDRSPSNENPRPNWFEADGQVVAVRPAERLAARHVEATLSPGPDGRPTVQTLDASGLVDLRARREGLEVIGEELAADVPAQRLVVLGTPDRLARVTRGRTTISGLDVRLTGAPRSASVFGAGSFNHAADASLPTESDSKDPIDFNASWTQVMKFDDAAGTLRCVGDVGATMRQGTARVDRLSAWTVEATIDPPAAANNAAPPTGPTDPPLSSSPPGESESNGTEAPQGSPIASAEDELPADAIATPIDAPDDANRRILTMVAIGSIHDSPDGEPATIESRRYGPPGADGTRVLQQLLYLEGARILADNAAGTLDVPGSGKLVVVDRRTPESERPAASTPLEGGTARGDALFNWEGSLHVERRQTDASMTMSDRVRMVHRRAGDDLTTLLDAPTLTARTGGASDSQLNRLRAVHAEGGVWVRSGTQEITADIVDYDADTGILTAFSRVGNPVRVADGPTVWNAGAVRWDMAAGRIEIVDPSGLVTPR